MTTDEPAAVPPIRVGGDLEASPEEAFRAFTEGMERFAAALAEGVDTPSVGRP